jgi:hypothetical protein
MFDLREFERAHQIVGAAMPPHRPDPERRNIDFDLFRRWVGQGMATTAEQRVLA